jgi:NitT/TauT family transport system substrate-binding protein
MTYRMGGVTRRALLAGSAGLAVALPVRRAAAAESLTVRLDWSTHGVHAPFFLAAAKGWFTNAGLDVAIEDGNGSTTTVQLVGAGQFDIGHAALAPMALGRAKGLPITSIAGFIRKGDTGFLVPKTSGWTKPSDLIGKKIVYTAGSLEGPFMTPFFRKNKIGPDQLNLLNVDASAKVSVYLSGNADAVVSTVPYVMPLTVEKRPSNGILFADFGMNLPGFGLVVNHDTLAKRGPALSRFASIVSGAWAYILAGHEQEGVDAVLQARPQSPVPAGPMRMEIEAYRPYFTTPATTDMAVGLQSPLDWARTIADMSEAETIPATSKPGDFFTNDYIDAALVKKIAASS